MNSKYSKPTYLKIEPVLPFGFLIQQSFNIFSSKLNPSTLRASIAGRSAIGPRSWPPFTTEKACLNLPLFAVPTIFSSPIHFFLKKQNSPKKKLKKKKEEEEIN